VNQRRFIPRGAGSIPPRRIFSKWLTPGAEATSFVSKAVLHSRVDKLGGSGTRHLVVIPKYYLSHMKDAILNHIKDNPYTSFADLADSIPNFSGDYALFQPEFPNVIVWPALSEVAVDSLVSLLRDRKIIFTPVSQLTYHIDGIRPKMPIALGPKNYKYPRWLPVCICIPEQKSAEARYSEKKPQSRKS
jgi:hypothetical protein